MGNPLDETTQVGAIISREQLDRVERYVAMARETPGARILTGGERPQDEVLRQGLFLHADPDRRHADGFARLPRRDLRSRCDRGGLVPISKP